MKIKISEQLNSLAKLFSCPLYIVGGYVRNALLGITSEDIDIASELTPDGVTALLKDSGYQTVEINKRLGTLKIYAEGTSESYEYTTFREDSYPQSGAHSPETVCFTKDILTDAKRRDLKANAVYYDILKGEIFDPLNGIADIKSKVFSTTRKASEVFNEDGLRIMRLVRLSAELGFLPEAETFKAAKEKAALLRDISPERIREEFIKIINADLKYPVLNLAYAHERGVRLLDEVGAFEYVLPEIQVSKGFKQNSKYHKYDVFEHTMVVFRNSAPEVRLAALFHDLGKPEVAVIYGNMKKHAEAGVEIAERVMANLKFGNAEIKHTAELVALHMYDLKCDVPEDELKLFIVKYQSIIGDLISLKRADMLGSISPELPSVSADRMETLYGRMKADGTPFSVKDLKVTGGDLIKADIPEKKRGLVLDKLLNEAVVNPATRTKEEQQNYIINCSKKNTEE